MNLNELYEKFIMNEINHENHKSNWITFNLLKIFSQSLYLSEWFSLNRKAKHINPFRSFLFQNNIISSGINIIGFVEFPYHISGRVNFSNIHFIIQNMFSRYKSLAKVELLTFFYIRWSQIKFQVCWCPWLTWIIPVLE